MVSNPQVSVARCLDGRHRRDGGAVDCVVAWLLPAVAHLRRRRPSPARWSGSVPSLPCVAAAWLWVATVVTVLAALRGREQYAVAVAVPAPLRRVVLAACGVGARPAAWLASWDLRTRRPDSRTRTGSAAPRAAVAGLPLPDRATAPAALGPRSSWSRPGRHALGASPPAPSGAGASDAEIDAAWRRLHDLNRAEIGPDPDLIRPAQRLEVLP